MGRRGAFGHQLAAATGSALTGLVFNAALFALPFAATALVETTRRPDIIDYTPTPATRRSTLNAIETEASRFVQRGDDRHVVWEQLIARELSANDQVAARGFALLGTSILSPAEAARLHRRSTAGDRDTAMLEAALPLMDPSIRRSIHLAPTSGATSFNVLGDLEGFSEEARRWVDGELVDGVALRLTGAAQLEQRAPNAEAIRLGASVLKIAKNSGRLGSDFLAWLETRLEAALPAERLRAELAYAFANGDRLNGEGTAVAAAFAAASRKDGLRAVANDLAVIGAMARGSTPAAAAQLLSQAKDSRDLQRLLLLAEAGGERAVAIAKRTPDRLVLGCARGAINWSGRLPYDLASLLLSLLAALLATISAVTAKKRATGPNSTNDKNITTGGSKADAVRAHRAPA
jgi:hypothetical protein